jgi:hypothetical protein
MLCRSLWPVLAVRGRCSRCGAPHGGRLSPFAAWGSFLPCERSDADACRCSRDFTCDRENLALPGIELLRSCPLCFVRRERAPSVPPYLGVEHEVTNRRTVARVLAATLPSLSSLASASHAAARWSSLDREFWPNDTWGTRCNQERKHRMISFQVFAGVDRIPQ